MRIEFSNLTVLNPNTAVPQVFWNGIQINGVRRVRILSDEDTQRVKIVVSGTQSDLYAEMRAADIVVKEV
jgi:hypothetical protein